MPRRLQRDRAGDSSKYRKGFGSKWQHRVSQIYEPLLFLLSIVEVVMYYSFVRSPEHFTTSNVRQPFTCYLLGWHNWCLFFWKHLYIYIYIQSMYLWCLKTRSIRLRVMGPKFVFLVVTMQKMEWLSQHLLDEPTVTSLTMAEAFYTETIILIHVQLS